MSPRYALILLCTLSLAGCGDRAPAPRDLADMPAARTSWSLAAASTERGLEIFGFQGMGPGLRRADAASDIYAYSVRDDAWRSVGKFPEELGRLSTSATLVGRGIWIGGGYTLEADGTENTMAGDYAFDPETGTLQPLEGLGARIDDTVAVAWQDRYVLYVGGWMQYIASMDVQVFDIESGLIELTEPMPLALAGHAGALIDNHIVICDGMTATPGADGKPVFAISNQCFLGTLGATAAELKWESIPPHPGKPRYRMAAASTRQHGTRVVFAGGAEQPYSFNGKSYDGSALALSDEVISFDLDKRQWHQHASLPVAISDVRNLPEANGELFVMGGLRKGGVVSQRAFAFQLSKPRDPE